MNCEKFGDSYDIEKQSNLNPLSDCGTWSGHPMFTDKDPRIVIGVDACKGGWVFIQLENGAFASAKIYRRFADGVNASRDAAVICVDIPIRYPTPPAIRRQADDDARERVGPRHNSIFPTPHPDVLNAPDYDVANRISLEVTNLGLTPVSFALMPRILEVDHVAAHDGRVREVHPEVSFRELACQHLQWTKHHWNGQRERSALLANPGGIEIPDDLGEAGIAGPDDILDAAAAAWSANRIAAGHAKSLPAPPECDTAGRPVAIWY